MSIWATTLFVTVAMLAALAIAWKIKDREP